MISKVKSTAIQSNNTRIQNHSLLSWGLISLHPNPATVIGKVQLFLNCHSHEAIFILHFTQFPSLPNGFTWSFLVKQRMVDLTDICGNCQFLESKQPFIPRLFFLIVIYPPSNSPSFLETLAPGSQYISLTPITICWLPHSCRQTLSIILIPSLPPSVFRGRSGGSNTGHYTC